MDDHAHFKLLHLPAKMQRNVIRKMSPVQMFQFSQCTEGMKQLVKESIKRFKFNLELDIQQHFIFTIKDKNGTKLGVLSAESAFCKDYGNEERLKMDTVQGSTSFKEGGGLQVSSFENVYEGAAEMYEELEDLFSFSVKTALVHAELLLPIIRFIIDWTNNLDPNFDDVDIRISDEISCSTYHRLIKNLAPYDSINIHFDPNHRKMKFDMDGDRFYILNADWVTLDFLLDSDAPVMCFGELTLTDEELNVFLKSYLNNESNKKLEYATLMINQEFDIKTILNGIQRTRVDEDNVRKFEKYGLEATNEDHYRILTESREICYLGFYEFANGKGAIQIINWKDEVFEPVKLLNFPILVVEEVIKNLNPMEAFLLSASSRRMKHFAKSSFKKPQFTMQVQFREYFLFNLYQQGRETEIVVFKVYREGFYLGDEIRKTKIGNISEVLCDYERHNVLCTYLDDQIKGATELIKEFNDLFNIDFSILDVIKTYLLVDFGSVMDWVHQRNQDIKRIDLAGVVDDEVYSNILEETTIPKWNIKLKPSDTFQKPDFRFTAEHTHRDIGHAHWITMENLSTIHSTTLVLENIKFTNQDVNSLLKRLVNGAFPNLELISFGLNRDDIIFTEVLDGISDIENPNEEPRVFNRYGHKFEINITIDFQISTGETCSIQFYRSGEEEEELRVGLHAIVWK